MTPKVLVLRINFRVQIHPQKQLNIIPLPYYPWYTFHAGFIYFLHSCCLCFDNGYLATWIQSVRTLSMATCPIPCCCFHSQRNILPKPEEKQANLSRKHLGKKTTLPTVAVITIPQKTLQLEVFTPFFSQFRSQLSRRPWWHCLAPGSWQWRTRSLWVAIEASQDRSNPTRWGWAHRASAFLQRRKPQGVVVVVIKWWGGGQIVGYISCRFFFG